MYGASCLSPANYSDTTVCTSSHLNKLLKKPNHGNIIQVSLVGATMPEVGSPDLLYAVTKSQPKVRISNILQMSGAILSASRFVFLGHLSLLFSILDPAKVQLCYTGESSTKQHKQ